MSRYESVTFTNMCMIQDGQGRVLVQNRTDPGWPGYAFPGGHVERWESFTEAVIREVQEETGLTIAHPQLIGVKDWVDLDEETRYVVLLYRTDEFTGELRSSREGDVLWMTPEEMLAGRIAPGMDETLQIFLRPELSEQYFRGRGDQWDLRFL